MGKTPSVCHSALRTHATADNIHNKHIGTQLSILRIHPKTMTEHPPITIGRSRKMEATKRAEVQRLSIETDRGTEL